LQLQVVHRRGPCRSASCPHSQNVPFSGDGAEAKPERRRPLQRAVRRYIGAEGTEPCNSGGANVASRGRALRRAVTPRPSAARVLPALLSGGRAPHRGSWPRPSAARMPRRPIAARATRLPAGTGRSSAARRPPRRSSARATRLPAGAGRSPAARRSPRCSSARATRLPAGAGRTSAARMLPRRTGAAFVQRGRILRRHGRRGLPSRHVPRNCRPGRGGRRRHGHRSVASRHDHVASHRRRPIRQRYRRLRVAAGRRRRCCRAARRIWTPVPPPTGRCRAATSLPRRPPSPASLSNGRFSGEGGAQRRHRPLQPGVGPVTWGNEPRSGLMQSESAR
jgi:hypothetical protein